MNKPVFHDNTMNRQQLRAAKAVLRHNGSLQDALNAAAARGWFKDARKAKTYRKPQATKVVK